MRIRLCHVRECPRRSQTQTASAISILRPSESSFQLQSAQWVLKDLSTRTFLFATQYRGIWRSHQCRRTVSADAVNESTKVHQTIWTHRILKEWQGFSWVGRGGGPAAPTEGVGCITCPQILRGVTIWRLVQLRRPADPKIPNWGNGVCCDCPAGTDPF